MRKTTLAIGLAMAVATAAYAAPGYGPGYGQGYGPGNSPCATAGAADCPGPGAGYGMGRGRMGGWGPGGQGSLMTEQERDAHREKMHSFATLEQCTAYWTEHRAEMTRRAQERGVEQGPGPRFNPCERMAARGLLK